MGASVVVSLGNYLIKEVKERTGKPINEWTIKKTIDNIRKSKSNFIHTG